MHHDLEPHSFSPTVDGAAALAGAGLSPDEMLALAAYLVDGERQGVIGERIGLDQSNVSRLLARCVRKLRAVGIAIELPRDRVGRPRSRVQVLSGERMEQLTCDETADIVTGRFSRRGGGVSKN